MKVNSKKTVRLSLVLSIFLIALTALTPGDRYFEIQKNLDIFATLYKEVNTYYVDDINPNKVIKTGINAMLSELDPYTNYIPEDDIEDYRTMTTNQYGGIGALIGKRNGKNMVIMPYDGFPAHENGLIIGDEILAVDGIDVTEKSISEISKLLKGQANTKVNLTVKKFGAKETSDIELKREKITIDNVPYYGLVTNDIGYIKLSDFTTDAGKEVKDALVELKSKGATKVILDLRGNPGGLLSEAVNVSNVFIPKGSEVVTTKGKVKDWNKTYKALNNPVDTDIPLVVLTSSRSASASEIVAGVMQDYDRGVLVGQKSFGKGLVQATRPLSYNSQLKVTTAKYYTPSGRCIQAIDYSHRNPDGSVGKVPDSLKVAFQTKNGRTVYDGGGIDPDVGVQQNFLAPITVSLVNKSLLFEYANEYHLNNKQITPAKDFDLSDAEYEKFVSWLSTKDFDYTTKVEETLDKLKDIAMKEKYYDEIEPQINALRKQVMHNKELDLRKFKSEIKFMLEEEIVSRYYLQKGIIESSFDHDPDILQSVKVLNDQARYNKLLAN
ncbi:S41 family peptidase [Fulvivirgaceae bacterium BMA10]|uniref:S41 family peptidase n=1 Tax=Splendidivirga corallicola TaxID=3051826 RepID=A0ABT8KYS2_9BACT|nr:S41 family peptidase [Fulvivirgaceae bacterium BMA10]